MAALDGCDRFVAQCLQYCAELSVIVRMLRIDCGGVYLLTSFPTKPPRQSFRHFGLSIPQMNTLECER